MAPSVAGAIAFGSGAADGPDAERLAALVLISAGVCAYQPLLTWVLRRSGRSTDPLRRRLPATLVNVVALAVLVVASRRLGVEGRLLSGGPTPSWSVGQPIPVGVAIGAAIALGTAIGYRFPALRKRMADTRYSGLTTWRRMAVMALMILAGTTVFEEVLFRGFLIALWDQATSSIPVVVAASSVTFGLWHIAPALERARANPPRTELDEPSTAVVITVLFTAGAGVLFALLRLATGSVVPGILVHAAVNISAMIAAAAAWRSAEGERASRP